MPLQGLGPKGVVTTVPGSARRGEPPERGASERRFPPVHSLEGCTAGSLKNWDQSRGSARGLCSAAEAGELAPAWGHLATKMAGIDGPRPSIDRGRWDGAGGE